MKPSPILAALDAESYEFLATQNPELLNAVEVEIAAGKKPWQLSRIVSAYVGPDRDGLVKRIYQAASHVERMQAT